MKRTTEIADTLVERLERARRQFHSELRRYRREHPELTTWSKAWRDVDDIIADVAKANVPGDIREALEIAYGNIGEIGPLINGRRWMNFDGGNEFIDGIFAFLQQELEEYWSPVQEEVDGEL